MTTISVFDSTIYRDLFHDAEIGQIFSDAAEIRAMLCVEGALAAAQGSLGVIPETSAAAIRRACLDARIDPAALTRGTGRSAVCVPALVAALREKIGDPQLAQHVHWAATSQDIIDTGLMIRLRQVLAIYDTRLVTLLKGLGELARIHAELPMAARTWAQVATPTSFGAIAAGWGRPFLSHRVRLDQLRPRLLQVSLSGASGTLSAMGERGPAIRTALAEGLGLADPARSWHSAREGLAEFAAWLTAVSGSLAKMGADLIGMTQGGIEEVALGSVGGSSTMPQKTNPVLPNLLVALAGHTAALNSPMQTALVHRQQRDGAAWMLEWMALPQMCMAVARALTAATELAGSMRPDPHNMRASIDGGFGLIYAEALCFALADHMPRPEAQTRVKSLCTEARETGTSLADLVRRDFPDLDVETVFRAEAQLGVAPEEAHAFAERIQGL
ncbi:MAG: adenylosuccinate lyase family protein [Pseudomonadota bacterium]